MQIVTDSGADIAQDQRNALENVHVVPLTFSLEGKSYRSGVDIDPEGFYRLLAGSSQFPTTSQPAPGDFATFYRQLAQTDPDILSIHVSSGLSGTMNAARLGAQMVPEAQVTFVDSKTLSGAQGWQVIAAAQAATLGWDKTRILDLLSRISEATDTLYTLATLKYLVHGGRVSHIRGMVGSLLDIKPIIGVEKVGGTYTQRGSVRSLNKAILMLGDLVAKQHAPGTHMRFQVMHGANEEGAALLTDKLKDMYPAEFLPSGPIAPVLGAHTGPGLVGIVYAPQAAFTFPSDIKI